MKRICKNCVFFDLLGEDFTNTHFYRHAGECRNKLVHEDCEGPLVQAGGFDGYGDYFHVHEDFGCIKFKRKGKGKNNY